MIKYLQSIHLTRDNLSFIKSIKLMFKFFYKLLEELTKSGVGKNGLVGGKIGHDLAKYLVYLYVMW